MVDCTERRGRLIAVCPRHALGQQQPEPEYAPLGMLVSHVGQGQPRGVRHLVVPVKHG
jgi:hypothetical protein